ncbi:roadblock/LC7 domain-containing protein [Streptosporangium sp. NBC_01755]|uniref:roadblock/LC7 domain-containing protein n=1 Tax=unclassified Streptosporangium TaxID=2632669 RepID=UPI002DD8A6F8|nr:MULTISPECIES: roadblock/LC7 domain-containing protein [unclassified Streptosporangium]WSA24743.1 roadblock/LC7 domain-containing protein [Streptosporangium sp. NBC_01810]WSC97181.1 roadblock/LC7 domain-containing protein [Streptosporangium sp. NBC_01755]
MTVPAYPVSNEAQQFNWLLDRFARDTAGVAEAIAVSTDGLLVAMSNEMRRIDADRLAAIVSALASLANGASGLYGLGETNKIIIDLDGGYVLVSNIGRGCVLGVLARKEANLGNLAFEMAMFSNQAGPVLTPQLIDELKSTVRI